MIIKHVFKGTDMRQGHDGLFKHAKIKGIDLKKLDHQEGVVFVSRDRMRMKLYGFNGVLSYLRRNELQRPFDLEAVNEFYRCFDSRGNINYDQALKLRLENFMSKKGKGAEKQSKHFGRL